MKKIALSVLFTIGFGVYGFATNKIEIQIEQHQKEETSSTKKKIERYDFSLFKFVIPQPKKEEKDSTKIVEELLKHKTVNNETTYHQEKPLDFFMFS